MSLSTAIAVNVIADLAIIGLLAYVMSRAAALRPQVPLSAAPEQPAARRPRIRAPRRPARASSAPQPARS
jgi:hypothetical protein